MDMVLPPHTVKKKQQAYLQTLPFMTPIQLVIHPVQESMKHIPKMTCQRMMVLTQRTNPFLAILASTVLLVQMGWQVLKQNLENLICPAKWPNKANSNLTERFL